MAALAVSVVVVVGSGIVIGRWLARSGESVERATSRPEPARAIAGTGVGGQFALRPARDLRTPWWHRVRSAIVLGCVSVSLGVAVAAGVGIVLFLLFTALRSSVG